MPRPPPPPPPPVDLLSSSQQHCKIEWPKTTAAAGYRNKKTAPKEGKNSCPFDAVKKRTNRRSSTSAAMTTEDNGNVGLLKPTSSSNEDLSEYTDADESISAPTEFLAEFLSAVMLKDYVTALKYCKLILQYEPNNATAKEFYPLILEKLQQTNEDGSSNDSENGEEDVSEENSTSSTSSDSDSSSSSEDSSEGQEQEDEEEVEEEEDEVAGGLRGGGGGDKRSKGSSDGGDATTGSYSSLEDDEPETDQLAALAAKYQIDNVNLGNGNKIYGTHLSTGLDDNYSPGTNSLIVPSGNHHQMTVPLLFGTSSDSESPTEPVSQQTVQMAAMLRARVVPNKQ